MRQVFVSYARDDDEWKALVEDAVRRAGLRPWTDDHLVPGTPRWAGEIERAIQGSVALVVVLTPAAKGSGWVANEVAYAQQQGVRVIPVLAEGTATTSIPIDLITAHHVDLRQPGAVRSLVRELSRLGGPSTPSRRPSARRTTPAPSPTPPQVPPRRPIPAPAPPPAPRPAPAPKARPERRRKAWRTRSVVRVAGAALLRFGSWLLARVRAAFEQKPLPAPVPLSPAGSGPVGSGPAVSGRGVAAVAREARLAVARLWAALRRPVAGSKAWIEAVRDVGHRSHRSLVIARHVAFVIDAGVVLIAVAAVVTPLTMAIEIQAGEFGEECRPVSTAPRCDDDSIVGGAVAGVWMAGAVALGAGSLLLRRTTPGKAVMRLRVVGADGGPPSTRAVLIRTVLLPVDVYVGTLVSAIDGEGRRLGDLVAGTHVVPVGSEGWAGPVRPF